MRQTESRTVSASRSSRAPRPRAVDRRTRARLRDLCDEVLASYRVARGADSFSDEDRAAAAELLPRLAPLGR